MSGHLQQFLAVFGQFPADKFSAGARILPDHLGFTRVLGQMIDVPRKLSKARRMRALYIALVGDGRDVHRPFA